MDAGYRYKQIASRLQDFGLTPADVNAIIITHEHSDHISALPYLTRGLNAVVYAPEVICDYICRSSYCANVLPVSGRFCIGELTVDIYRCSHDARECLGYKFTCGKESVASVTDTGCVNDELIEFLLPCKGVALESNHDVDMLNNGSYPYPLKRRILSKFGHLSNAQAAQVILGLKGSNVKEIILSHLSEQNNTKEIAFNTAVEALNEAGLVEGKDVRIYVADQYVNRITLC